MRFLPTVQPLEAREVPSLSGLAGGSPLSEQVALDLNNTFSLHSLPGSPNQVYLDFTGGTRDLRGTVWGYVWPTITYPAFDQDGNPNSFSPSELTTIQNIWKRVAEDYAPFNVDVTTAPPTVISDRYQTVLIGGDGEWYNTKRTVSGVTASQFGYGSPNFVFSSLVGSTEKNTAEVISHELGHTFGLSHQSTSTAEYYTGSGSGITKWAPILGSAFSANLSQFSKGEFPGATNTQDETLVIGSRLGWRPDLVGNSFDTAAALLIGQQTTNLIETREDVDLYRFQASGGSVSVNFSPAYGTNLYGKVSLFDSAGNLIASTVPTSSLNYTLTATVSGGTYYIQVDGVGFGTVSDYGSLGQYWLRVDATPIQIPPPAPPVVPPPPPPPPPTPDATVSIDSITKAETNTGLYGFNFTLRLSRWLPYPVVIYYTTEDGTATAGEDYRPLSGTVTLAPYASKLTLSVLVVGDRVVEPDEVFGLKFAILGGNVLAESDTAIGSILDNDGFAQGGPLLFLAPDEKKDNPFPHFTSGSS